MIWLAVGTAPGVRDRLDDARAHKPDRVITCNGGIRIWPNPDVYAVVDHVACDEYEAEALEAKDRGVRIVAPALPLQKSLDSARAAGYSPHVVKRTCLECSELVSLEGYESIRLTGPWCLEYAARNGATRIVMVGCTGYPSDGTPLYEEGVYGHESIRGRPPKGAKVLTDLNQVLARIVNNLIGKYPAVEWVHIGEPVYADRMRDWPNWRVEA